MEIRLREQIEAELKDEIETIKRREVMFHFDGHTVHRTVPQKYFKMYIVSKNLPIIPCS